MTGICCGGLHLPLMVTSSEVLVMLDYRLLHFPLIVIVLRA